MNHLFVPYRIAKSLKKKGFKDKCFMWQLSGPGQPTDDNIFRQYVGEDSFVDLPIHQQVIDWFRVKHKIFFTYDITTNDHVFCIGDWKRLTGKDDELITSEDNDYYTALNGAIEEALKLI